MEALLVSLLFLLSEGSAWTEGVDSQSDGEVNSADFLVSAWIRVASFIIHFCTSSFWDLLFLRLFSNLHLFYHHIRNDFRVPTTHSLPFL